MLRYLCLKKIPLSLPLYKQRGLSLVELIISIGISSLVVAAVALMFSRFTKSQNRVDKVGNRESVVRQILETMDCAQTLTPYCTAPNCKDVVPTCPAATGPNPAVSKVTLKNALGGTIVAANGQRFGDWVVRAGCIPGSGLRLRIAGIKKTAAVDTQTASDFLLDPLTSTPLNWTAPHSTLLAEVDPANPTAASLSCTSFFTATPGATINWCPAPATLTQNPKCPAGTFQVGYSFTRNELCCDSIVGDGTTIAQRLDKYARWSTVASNRVLNSSLREDGATVEFAVGGAIDPLSAMTVYGNSHIGMRIDALTANTAGFMVLEGNKLGPQSDVASIDFRNWGSGGHWWHVTLRGDTNNLEFHHRSSFLGAAPANIIQFTTAAHVVAQGYTVTSDRRLKTNISVLNEDTLAKLHLIEGVRYRLKTDNSDSAFHLGVIAQQVEQVYPELVGTPKTASKAVNYGGLMPILIEAIKKLDTNTASLQTTQLKSDLKDLQDEFKEQGALIEQLQNASNHTR